MLILKNVARSAEVTNHIAKHLQNIHEDFRQVANMGQRLNDIKHHS
jgi:hypothetical protein